MLDTPLFRYASSRGLSDLQKLATDMKANGVFYNNSLGERILITKDNDKELFDKALNIVEKAILALHSDGCRDEERHNPGLDKEIAPTEPNIFFVTTDGEGKYLAPIPESDSNIPASKGHLETKQTRSDSGVWAIAGFLLYREITEHCKSNEQSADDIIATIASGSSPYINTLRKKFNLTQVKDHTNDRFSEHVKKAAESYLKGKHKP